LPQRFRIALALTRDLNNALGNQHCCRVASIFKLKLLQCFFESGDEQLDLVRRKGMAASPDR
jgi:hypothetical protein